MATFKAFAEIDGKTVELLHVYHAGPGTKAKHFRGLPEGVEQVFVEGKGWNTQFIPATRYIEYKSNPSKHKCDARCLNAKGFKCECECGGKNHGRGFVCD